MSEMRAELIAACGINCRLCMAYTRKKDRCPGCKAENEWKPKHCTQCTLALCEKLRQNGWENCAPCEKPCRRLKQLDARYVEKHHMSMRENLAYISEHGMEAFLQWEDRRWRCPDCGGIVSVHRPNCPECGVPVDFDALPR